MTGTAEMASEQNLLLAACRTLAEDEPYRLEPVDGGMTNRNYQLATKSGRYFVQLLLPDTVATIVGISRPRHLLANMKAAELGIAPGVVAAFDNPRILVTAFVDGQTVSGAQVAEDAILRQVATLLQTLHSAPPEPELDCWVAAPFEGTWRFRDLAKENDPEFVTAAGWLLELTARFQTARGAWVSCLTHIDLLASNIILGDRLWLVDWEYAGLGDPLYDLADYAAKNDLTEAATQTLLSYYSGAVDPRDLAIIRLYRISSLLREALWAVAMIPVKFSDFDHKRYAAETIRRTAAIARQPETARHMKTLGCELPKAVGSYGDPVT
jgi:thiamine kinase-like enzyme